MVSLLNIGAVLLGLAALLLSAQVIAWALATQFIRLDDHGYKYRGPLINFKPFNCRPCLTFWVTLTLLVIIVLGAPQDVTVQQGINAIVLSFINYFYINSKFKVYE